MDKLKWREKKLKDSDVAVKLSELQTDEPVTEVDLSDNFLENIPYFNKYKQFERLEKLNLSENNRMSMDSEKLPCHIKELHMYDNKISELGDLSQHHRLEVLGLGNNKLTSIDPSKLPRHIKVLYIQGNDITEMRDISQHRELIKLHLYGNKITDIDPVKLPVNLEELNMAANQLTQVGDFSEHKKLAKLNLSHNHISEIDPSRVPINIKDIAISDNRLTVVGDFSKHKQLDRLDLTGNEIIRIYDVNTNISFWRIDTFGDKFFDNEYGYNHLITCNFKTVYLMQPPQEVLKRGLESVQRYFKDMALSNRVKNSRKRLVLLGTTNAGKSSMVESLIAGKAMLVNAEDRTQVINLKQWNITRDDIVHIYDHGGHMIYSITRMLFISKHSIIFLVHDITKIQHSEIIQTTDVLRQTLHQNPDNEIYIIFTHTDLIHEDEVLRNSDVLMAAMKKFLDDEISNLNKILIREKSKRKNNEQKEKQDFVDATDALLKLFRDKQSHLQFFCVSSENYAGMDEVKDFVVKVAKKKRAAVPESWVKFYKLITESNKIYLTLDETLHLFEKSTGTRVGSDNRVPLQYFTDINLCLHYDDNPLLNDYVFPDIDVIADLFKSLFHHNLAQVINYDTDEKLQANFQKGECDLAVKRYQKEGLLGQKLLSYLWQHYGFSLDDETVLLKLMQSFNLCYSVSKEDDLQFFPWFVQSQECPSHIDSVHLMKFDNEHSSVHLQCEFFNQIPLNVFEMISVCLQRKATHECHYMGDRQAWHDGLEISFGSVQCVLTRSEQNSTIDICLHGKVNDMPQVWKVIESLLHDLQSILQPWDGVIRSIHFVCGHCIILHIFPPNHWLPEQVFPQKNVLVPAFVHCPMQTASKDIPAALIMACFNDDDTTTRKSLTDVTDYLKKHWEARDPPPALLYLDCEQIQNDVFSLNWCLSQSRGDSITSCLLQVKDGEGQWKPCDSPVQGTSFTFKGPGVEFRVAAQNKYGTGPYKYCTPSVNIPDQPLLPREREALKSSDEMFAQMSCIEPVTTRLCGRGVLHRDAGKRVLDCLKQYGTKEGAKKLVDEVCRCTYKQLHLFRKTLAEFGQESLATLVPMKTTDEFASQYEPYDAPGEVALSLGHQSSSIQNTESSLHRSTISPFHDIREIHPQVEEQALFDIRSGSVVRDQHQQAEAMLERTGKNVQILEENIPGDVPIQQETSTKGTGTNKPCCNRCVVL